MLFLNFFFLFFSFLSQNVLAETFFYITFHGGDPGVNNIYKYTLNGTLLDKSVLKNDPNLRELRSMVLIPSSNSNDQLLVANAYKKDSRIVSFSSCQSTPTEDGFRVFIENFTTSQLSHPYGLALGDGVLFVSNQDTSSVSVYNLTTRKFLSSVVVNSTAIRSIAFDKTQQALFISDEDNHLILVYWYDASSQQLLLASSVHVSSPIGLFFDEAEHFLYVGSKKQNGVIAIAVSQQNLEVDGKNRAQDVIPSFDFKEVTVYASASISHPAGMVIVPDANNQQTLYVLSQDTKQLFSFNLVTHTISIVIDSMEDAPEQIIVSNC